MTGAPIGWHVTLRLEDGRNLVPGVRERRLLASAVLGAGRDRGLFVFSAPDTHVHLGTSALRVVAGELAHAVECALQHALKLPAGFETARFKPIADQAHLSNVVPYVLGNGRRHGSELDPCCEATNVPDLLGLRITGRYTVQRLRSLAPRLTRADLLQHLPVDELRAGADPVHLADAAAASLALPRLRGRGRLERAAQVAAVHVARQLGQTISRSADLLQLGLRTISRHRTRDPQSELVQAIRLQIGLRERD